MKGPRSSSMLGVLIALAALGTTASARPVQQANASTYRQVATSDVRDFGAAGDGQTDDTVAIQQALDGGTGKEVYVPAGVYNVRPLRVRTATVLKLDAAATLVLAPGSNADLLTVTAGGASVVGGGTLDGNRSRQTTGAGVSVGGAPNVTIRDVRIVNTARGGVYAANAANLTISGVSVSGTGYIGIFAEATTGALKNLVIENSRVDRSSEGPSVLEGGILVHRTGAAPTVSGVRISGNKVTMPKSPRGEPVAIETYGGVENAVIQNNTTSGASIGISVAHTTTAVVSGNTVAGASVYGIELAASRGSSVSQNVVDCGGFTAEGIVLDSESPSGNSIASNMVTGCISRGIALGPGADRVSIVGNQVSQEGGYAIEVLSSADVKIAKNALEGNGVALKAVVGELSPRMEVTGNRAARFNVRGVLLYRADGSTVSSNNVSQSAGSAVHVMNTRGITMAANTIDGLGTASRGLVIDTSSNVNVTKNVFRNFTQGVLLYAVTPITLDLITVIGNRFSKTASAYATQLSGGASLGKVVFKNNLTS